MREAGLVVSTKPVYAAWPEVFDALQKNFPSPLAGESRAEGG
jgi:hypothetical protein